MKEYVIRVGKFHTDVVCPPGYPEPGELVFEIVGDDGSARITIDGKTYPARMVRDRSLDGN